MVAYGATDTQSPSQSAQTQWQRDLRSDGAIRAGNLPHVRGGERPRRLPDGYGRRW
jgi:hypothetical protein